MEYFDLWDSCMIKSLKLPKSGNQLLFLIQRVPSGRTSNALSIPYRFSASMFSSLIALAWALRICDAFSMLAACASTAVATLSATSFLMAAWVMAGTGDLGMAFFCSCYGGGGCGGSGVAVGGHFRGGSSVVDVGHGGSVVVSVVISLTFNHNHCTIWTFIKITKK
nr:hypothetical protein [Tanacetum cinerariifolium]